MLEAWIKLERDTLSVAVDSILADPHAFENRYKDVPDVDMVRTNISRGTHCSPFRWSSYDGRWANSVVVFPWKNARLAVLFHIGWSTVVPDGWVICSLKLMVVSG